MEINEEILRAARAMGEQWNCSPALHPDDHLMAWVINYSHRSVEHGPTGGLSEFFEQGANDAKQITTIARRLNIAPTCAVLEFACGYGRVSRHLSPVFSNFTCSDIHPDAVQFLRSHMGLNAIQSAAEPRDFAPGRTFDFIFVLSLFSHLPQHLFGAWLGRLYALLNYDGILMFTTHGEVAMKKQPLLAQNLNIEAGFGFLQTSDQADLDPAIYGSSTALPHYVKRAIQHETNNTARLVDFTPGEWWGAQDQWIIQKSHPHALGGLCH